MAGRRYFSKRSRSQVGGIHQAYEMNWLLAYCLNPQL